jgi:hypothetical protein
MRSSLTLYGGLVFVASLSGACHSEPDSRPNPVSPVSSSEGDAATYSQRTYQRYCWGSWRVSTLPPGTHYSNVAYGGPLTYPYLTDCIARIKADPLWQNSVCDDLPPWPSNWTVSSYAEARYCTSAAGTDCTGVTQGAYIQSSCVNGVLHP